MNHRLFVRPARPYRPKERSYSPRSLSKREAMLRSRACLRVELRFRVLGNSVAARFFHDQAVRYARLARCIAILSASRILSVSRSVSR